MGNGESGILDDSDGVQGRVPEVPAPCFVFADYCLFPNGRVLLKGASEISLRGREFDLLIALLENAGTFLNNEVLIARVWPSSTVSESNLRVQIASLRRALGDNGSTGRMIVNVTGRGYSFALPVSRDQALPIVSEPAPRKPTAPAARQTSLPTRLTDLIGRESAIAKLLIHVPHRRLLTIVGPGGMGKTSIAVALAESRGEAFADGAYFVDFAAIADGSHLAVAVTKAINLRLETDDPVPAILEWLSDRSALIILDNCEHVIEAAAEFAEKVLHAAPGVHFICTSREALRVQGEWVHRLPPLEVPPPSDTLTVDEARAYSSIELFVERARACSDSFEMSEQNAPDVAAICRQLDGIPLAIELAAARVDRLNVRALAELLPDRLQLLGPGKRTAKPHQQTLRATLDWSYRLLAERDRTTLNRLSIFRNVFTLEAMLEVAGDEAINEADLADSLFELIGKSLVVVEPLDGIDYYRLLETTRIYTTEKLAQSGEGNAVAAKHAALCRALLIRARDVFEMPDQADWISAYGRWMDDVTAAVDWAYSTDGNVVLGIELAALSARLAVRLALLREHLVRVTDAANKVRSLIPPNPMLELRVNVELCYLLQHTTGNTPELRRLYDLVVDLGQKFSGKKEIFEAYEFEFGMCFSQTDWVTALEVGIKAAALVQSSEYTELCVTADRMRAQAFHYLARHAEAVICGQQVVSVTTQLSNYTVFTRVDPRISARVVMARSLWLLGEFENALEEVHHSLAFAEQFRSHPLCQALSMGAVPLAIWGGDHAAASNYASAIVQVANESGMDFWIEWGRNIALTMSAPPKQVSALKLEPLMLDDLCTYNRHLVTADVVARIETGQSPWCAPEVLRADVANQIDAGTIRHAEAEARLERALALAQSQDARAWELRIAHDLASLKLSQGDRSGGTLLEAVLSRLQRGFETADVQRAAALLATLG